MSIYKFFKWETSKVLIINVSHLNNTNVQMCFQQVFLHKYLIVREDDLLVHLFTNRDAHARAYYTTTHTHILSYYSQGNAL